MDWLENRPGTGPVRIRARITIQGSVPQVRWAPTGGPTGGGCSCWSGSRC